MKRHIYVHFHDSGEWEANKHPRAANGQFGSGGKGTPKPKMLKGSIESAANEKGMVISKDVFAHAPEDMMELYSKHNVEEFQTPKHEIVHLKNLVPTQYDISVRGVNRALQNKSPSKGHVEVYKDGDKYLIVDGHHRAAAAIINSRGHAASKIMVKIVGEVKRS